MVADSKNTLEVEALRLNFGSVQALVDVSFTARQGEILALIGPNGAGKTSLLNCISGFYHPRSGHVRFCGSEIGGFSPSRRAKLGISRTFQNIELYMGLTTLENLMAARHIFITYGPVAGSIFLGKARREEIKNRSAVEDIIDLLELAEARHKVVESLPYGLRKRIDLGRALALEPKLLLLDEPMAGMNVEEKEDMARFILDIQELRHIPIIIVEHDMGVVMDISQQVVVLDFGTKIAQGPPNEIKRNEKVISAYLGKTNQSGESVK
ncbi:MAG: ABC transporter ATP-binding protein [Pseudomonadota bacterium]